MARTVIPRRRPRAAKAAMPTHIARIRDWPKRMQRPTAARNSRKQKTAPMLPPRDGQRHAAAQIIQVAVGGGGKAQASPHLAQVRSTAPRRTCMVYSWLPQAQAMPPRAAISFSSDSTSYMMTLSVKASSGDAFSLATRRGQTLHGLSHLGLLADVAAQLLFYRAGQANAPARAAPHRRRTPPGGARPHTPQGTFSRKRRPSVSAVRASLPHSHSIRAAAAFRAKTLRLCSTALPQAGQIYPKLRISSMTYAPLSTKSHNKFLYYIPFIRCFPVLREKEFYIIMAPLSHASKDVIPCRTGALPRR